MTDALGPQFGRLFLPNFTIDSYDLVLLFPDARTVTRANLRKGLKSRAAATSVLIVGRDFTKEARDIAFADACDVLAKREFGWTDDAYIAARNA